MQMETAAAPHAGSRRAVSRFGDDHHRVVTHDHDGTVSFAGNSIRASKRYRGFLTYRVQRLYTHAAKCRHAVCSRSH
jgi:hypothetical protein